jgi:hypothetical protein
MLLKRKERKRRKAKKMEGRKDEKGQEKFVKKVLDRARCW